MGCPVLWPPSSSWRTTARRARSSRWSSPSRGKEDTALAEIPVVAFSANVEGDLPGAVATFRKGTVDPGVLLGVIERASLKG